MNKRNIIVETIHLLSFITLTVFGTSLLGSDLLVVASFKNGEVFYQRDKKELEVTKGQIFEKKDKIQTKNGILDLQVGLNSIIRIGKFTSISLTDLLDEKGKLKVNINLNSGSVLAKVNKKLDKNSEFKITTPTKTAGVRGTQFLVQEGEDTESPKEKIEDGVYVSEGVVEVKADKSNKPISVKAGQELITSQNELKLQILNSLAQEKIKILDSLNIMNETNYKSLQEQYQKNKDLMKK
ncbi:MAG: FecR family protein [Leptospiraceae bacterium]|nr:FecR family protein [Leptospiraceae bacterium]